eukprot:scpid60098/ scgid12554/ 
MNEQNKQAHTRSVVPHTEHAHNRGFSSDLVFWANEAKCTCGHFVSGAAEASWSTAAAATPFNFLLPISIKTWINHQFAVEGKGKVLVREKLGIGKDHKEIGTHT